MQTQLWESLKFEVWSIVQLDSKKVLLITFSASQFLSAWVFLIHRVSYRAVSCFLPPVNNFPTGYSFVQKVTNTFENSKIFSDSNGKRSVCNLNFRFQLQQVVRRNICKIFIYRESQEYLSREFDIKDQSVPPLKINENNNLSLHLIWSTDGVNIKKSSIQKGICPIRKQVAQLPPKLQIVQKNIDRVSWIGCAFC